MLTIFAFCQTDTFTTSDKKIGLEITHTFFGHTVSSNADNQDHVGSQVTVKNVGIVGLKDVKVYVDLDDDSPAFDAMIYGIEGHYPIGDADPILSFGDLAPGATSVKKSYWWTVRPKFPGAQGSATKTVSFNLYPTFTVNFLQQGEPFVSKAKLDNA
jgi:hypothetical protein